jgi:hypothetical protein
VRFSSFSARFPPNAPAPPRYPGKPAESRRLITQTRRKSADFAATAQPSGRTSPAAAFGRNREAGLNGDCSRNPVRFTARCRVPGPRGGVKRVFFARFTSRADPVAPCRISGHFFPPVLPRFPPNAPTPPRYPGKPAVSRRLITQTRRKSAGFAASSQPSGRTSPVAAFCGITEARRDAPLAGRVSAGYAGREPGVNRPEHGLFPPQAGSALRVRLAAPAFPASAPASPPPVPPPHRTIYRHKLIRLRPLRRLAGQYPRLIPIGPIGRVVCRAGIRGPPCCRGDTLRVQPWVPHICPVLPSSQLNRTSALHNLWQL